MLTTATKKQTHKNLFKHLAYLQIMSLPRVADNKPIKVAVEAGKEYYYCTCGLSKNQPW